MVAVDLNTWVLLGLGFVNLATALLTWDTRNNIRVVEKATNSMKDALVLATGKAEHAAGVVQGRQESADGIP